MKVTLMLFRTYDTVDSMAYVSTLVAAAVSTVPDRGGRISLCGFAARRLSWNATVRV